MPSSWAPSTCSRRTIAPVASSAWPYSISSLLEQRRRPRGGVERHHARAREQLDVCSSHHPRRMDERVLLGLAALQVALRRRRAVVGRVELAPDEEDQPSKPSSRSVAAAVAEAMPPPMSRMSTSRSGKREPIRTPTRYSL